MGSRFLMSHEANTNWGYKKALLQAKSTDTHKSEIYSGRPMRILKNKHNLDWANRESEIRDLLSKGIVPFYQDHEKGIILSEQMGPLAKRIAGIGKNTKEGQWNDITDDKTWNKDKDQALMGQCVGAVDSIIPAAQIVKNLMQECVKASQGLTTLT